MSIYKNFKDRGLIFSKEKIAEQISAGFGSHIDLEEDLEEEVLLEEWKSLRREIPLSEWIDFILTSVGYNPEKLLFFEKMFVLMKLLPFCESGKHILDLGPKSIGKSYTYQNLTKESLLYTGGMTTASLFLDGRNKKLGIIHENEVVAFDEMSEESSIDEKVIKPLRTFMESKKSGTGAEEPSSNASLVFLGNITDEDDKGILDGTIDKSIDLFRVMPEQVQKDPFKSRISYLIPSWEMRRKIVGKYETKSDGVNIHYLFGILKNLKREFIRVNQKKISGFEIREVKAIQSTVSAFIKLLYPHGEYDTWEEEALFNLALYGKSLLYNQFSEIKKINENSNLDSWKNFVIKASLSSIEKMGILKIEEAYYTIDRVIIKPLGENKFYKIALNFKGIKFNQKEVEYYENALHEQKGTILPLERKSDDFSVVVQEYKKPKGNRQRVNLKNFNSRIFNYEKVIDADLRNELKGYIKEQEEEINLLTGEIGKLRKELKEKEKQDRDFKEMLEKHFRAIKLDMLELKSHIEDDGSSMQKVEEKSGFLKLVTDEGYQVKEVQDRLGFKPLKASDYSVEGDNVFIINFADVL